MMENWLPKGFSSLERLGNGSFGRVELIQREEDGALFALKILERQQGIDSAEVEIESLNVIDSPFVANLYEVLRQPNSVALLIDPALGGSLRQKIAEFREKSTPMPTEMIYTIFTQILLAIRAVHQAGVAHRDLGPANILFVHQDQSKELRVLLVDFGVSASVKNGHLKGSVGTPNYMSPELAKGESHNTKTDIYSLGVILYEMCELQLPKEKGEFKTFKYHKEFSELIWSMCSRNPNDRPSVNDILNRADISKYAMQYLSSKRIPLTAHDWNPVVIEFDDTEINFDDLPPIDSTIPTGSGRLLLSGRQYVDDKYYEEKMEAERVAYETRLRNEQIIAERREEQLRINNELKRQERQTHQKWKEHKDDLSHHKNDFLQRIAGIRAQKRDKNIKFNSVPSPNSIIPPILPTDPIDKAADELERTRFLLEKQFGAEKLLAAHKKLEEDMMLSPAELKITPKEYDAISRLIRKEREVFGA
ncbi:CAMK family protein kinase [Tritrichomonas foetus]|uniref:non-specific serine/threonine protein kinase n=1 Tax=Tritrichomonas foetus TaxID=1144522 RepID=A0A1J4JY19_9EUKA|nr:CAMK family protein kinase [Tritrichomonas foetus]|eukprot:OHT02406.1 CAMK family protein kinase [Tritrichomonas foetus]